MSHNADTNASSIIQSATNAAANVGTIASANIQSIEQTAAVAQAIESPFAHQVAVFV